MSKKELSELIAKVHDDIEGRYDLTAEDLVYIHAALCTIKPEEDPRDNPLIGDDSWIHDVEMGAR
jgi:hypothetical protein